MPKKYRAPKIPKADDLRERADALYESSKKRNNLYDRMDKLYDAESPEQKDDNVQLLRMPYATNAVDLVCDLASQQELSIEVPASKESKTAQQAADDQEKWLRASLSLNIKQQQRNLTGDSAWLGAQRALVCMRTIFSDSAVMETGKESYVLKGLPVILQVRDPRHMVWEESAATGLEFVSERWERPAWEINSLYPGVLSSKYEPTDAIEWMECWTPKFRTYYCDKEIVKVGGAEVVPHGYGVIPYAFGVARTSPRPNNRYRPMLASVDSVLSHIDTWYSILATAGWSSVTNAWAIYSDNYGKDGDKQVDLSPGATNYFSKDDKVEPLQRAPLPQDFFKLGDMLLQALQAGTFPFAMYGQMGMMMAGYAINMLTQSGRRTLAPIWHAIEMAYAGAFRNTMFILRDKVAPLLGTDQISLLVGERMEEDGEVRKGRLAKRALSINVKDIGDDWDCQVTLGDPMPQDEAANIRMAIEAVRGNILSRETVLTKFRIVPDALDEIERIEIDKLFVQLAAKEMVKTAVERGYLPEDIEELQEQEEQAPEQPQGPEQTAGQAGAEAGVNPAVMQQLAGMGQPMPDFNEMAGAPPAPSIPFSNGGM